MHQIVDLGIAGSSPVGRALKTKEKSMNYTIVGRTGRAQLAVQNGRFRVRLLPRSAHRSTSYATAGDQVYSGPDLEMALLHIKAWTGLEKVDLPAEVWEGALQEA